MLHIAPRPAATVFAVMFDCTLAAPLPPKSEKCISIATSVQRKTTLFRLCVFYFSPPPLLRNQQRMLCIPLPRVHARNPQPTATVRTVRNNQNQYATLEASLPKWLRLCRRKWSHSAPRDRATEWRVFHN